MDRDELAGALTGWADTPFEILEPGPATRAVIPQAWWPVAESSDPQERIAAALSLWNTDFLDLIPRFAAALHTDLVDVRVVKHSWVEAPTLDYVMRSEVDGYATWMGESPAGFVEPPLFDSLPQPVQVFLRTVHAGFTTWDGESCGLTAPRDMKTYAAYLDAAEDGVPGWFDSEWDHEIPLPDSRRFLRVTGRETYSDLLTSPDLPLGAAVTYYEPDLELTTFGEALEEFLMIPLEG